MNQDLKCAVGKSYRSASKPLVQPGEKYYSLKMRGERNPQWKGDDIHLTTLHAWVARHVPKPTTCESCHSARPYDAANISQEYKREPSDWQWLCRRCHMESDGRLERLKARLKDGSNRRAEKSGHWKGDNASIYQKKQWVLKSHIKPENCRQCNKQTQWLSLKPIVANPSRNMADWTWLCRSCERPLGWFKKK